MVRIKKTARFDKQIAGKITEIALKKGMTESRVMEEALALGLLKLDTIETTKGQGMGARLTAAVIEELGGKSDPKKSKGEQLAEAYGKAVLGGSKGWTSLD